VSTEFAKLWTKNLPLDKAIHRFTVGKDPITDLALMPLDIAASAAHTRTLHRGGYLSYECTKSLINSLEKLFKMAQKGHLAIHPEQEDCHTAIEHALTEMCREGGKRIHLGRSRNDQVILAFRLLLRDRAAQFGIQIVLIAMAFLDFAKKHENYLLPGYTHMRKAMPSSWGLWSSSFVEGLLEELEALEGIHKRLNRCPAHAAAGFGSPIPLDHVFTAKLLGFPAIQKNPIDVINSRGRHETALADWLSSVTQVLERAIWDLCIFSTEEFGFIELPEKFTTGSSIMPQKRNPDVLELARGICRQIRGQANTIRELSSGLPSSYHRDLQLIKAPTMDLLDNAAEIFAIIPHLINGLIVNQKSSNDACTDELYAAHAASKLAVSGLPFRDAYKQIAKEVLEGSFHPDRNELNPHLPIDFEGYTAELEQFNQNNKLRIAEWLIHLENLWYDPIPVNSVSPQNVE